MTAGTPPTLGRAVSGAALDPRTWRVPPSEDSFATGSLSASVAPRTPVLAVEVVCMRGAPLGTRWCYEWNNESRSEEHTSELQSQSNLVCRLLLEKKKKKTTIVRCGS